MSRLTLLLIALSMSRALHGQELNLVGHLPISGVFVTDIWEYVDGATGDRYSLVGSYSQIYVIDVNDPANPMLVTTIPMPGFDLRVWGNYLYGVTGGGGTNQAKIADLTIPASPVIVGSFNSSHTLFISDNGFLFAEYPGLKVYDLNINPPFPTLVLDENNSDGHASCVIGERLFDFHGTETNIYKVTWTADVSLSLLGSINSDIVYHHSGWTTKDGRYLMICDELASGSMPDITMWNIEDLANPVRVDEYNDPTATVHNVFIIDNYAYVSYYTSGLKVFDVSDPANITIADEYDTSPSVGEGYDGAYGVFPLSESGYIYVSDQTGLYIFSFDLPSSVGEPDQTPGHFALNQNYPNPFNPSTTIGFTIPEEADVRLAVTDLRGRTVAVLAEGRMGPGDYRREWRPEGVASGLYLYTLQAGDLRETRKLLYLR